MERAAISFDIDPSLLAIGMNAECLVVSGIRNRESDEEFKRIRTREIEMVLSDLSPESIEADPVLLGFRALHREMGCANRRTIPAPETLLKNLLRVGQMPSINLAVDIYNLVSLKTRLSCGAHDLALINGNIHLRPTNGTERFVPLGSTEQKAVKPGEYAYVDDGNDILCRLEVRQADMTKVSVDTRDCFYIVQGNRAVDCDYIAAAAREIIELTTRFCGGTSKIVYAARESSVGDHR